MKINLNLLVDELQHRIEEARPFIYNNSVARHNLRVDITSFTHGLKGGIRMLQRCNLADDELYNACEDCKNKLEAMKTEFMKEIGI